MTIYWNCPCGHEIEVDVRINEEDDLPERCPECNKVIPDKAHEQVQDWAIEKANDPLD